MLRAVDKLQTVVTFLQMCESSCKDVQKAPNGQNLHKVVVEEGTLTKDAAVKLLSIRKTVVAL